MDNAAKAGSKFADLIRIMDTLRGEGGCPWDKKQDEKSIANYFLEEVYEAIHALFEKDSESLAEELGDVLMEVVFLARIYREKGKFDMSAIMDSINQKMIRRHPHVFGGNKVKDAEEVVETWSKQKNSERNRESLFDGMSAYTPSLLTSFQIGLRAAVQGFDWRSSKGAFEKMKEEIQELEKAVAEGQKREISDELGDIFFSLANVSRHLGVNPEIALRRANQRFIKRFRYIEERLKEQERDLEQTTLEEMDELWDESKLKVEKT